MPVIKSTVNLPSSLMWHYNALLMERTGDRGEIEMQVLAVVRKQSNAELN